MLRSLAVGSMDAASRAMRQGAGWQDAVLLGLALHDMLQAGLGWAVPALVAGCRSALLGIGSMSVRVAAVIGVSMS